MYKLSIFLPSIRIQNLPKWYDSILRSLNYETVPEIVVCGPFSPPTELVSLENWKWIESFASPTVCSQKAALACTSDLIMTTVDDALFYPNVLKHALKIAEDLDGTQHNNFILGLPYIEGEEHGGKTLPPSYWRMGSSYDYFSIKPIWINICHFLLNKGTFLKYGGFDCRYQYLVHSTACLLARMQRDGVEGYIYPNNVTTCTWYEGETKDHKPIDNSQRFLDAPLFEREWSNFTGPPTFIDPDNWKLQPEHWKIRFGDSKPTSYQELYPNL